MPLFYSLTHSVMVCLVKCSGKKKFIAPFAEMVRILVRNNFFKDKVMLRKYLAITLPTCICLPN